MPSTKPGVQERILLHLLDYSDYKNSVEVPFSLSQMGIANAVAIARSNVPRAIAGLKDQGLLIERQAHVKGCLLYTSPSPRDRTRSRMPSSA